MRTRPYRQLLLASFPAPIAALTALLASTQALAQEPEAFFSFCAENEKVVVNCAWFDKQAKQTRVASMCASPDLSPTTGTLQFRYGVAGKEPELLAPEPATHPRDVLRASGTYKGFSWKYALHVQTRQGEYTVHHSGSAYGDGGLETSLVIPGKQGRKTVQCSRDGRFPEDPDIGETFGIPSTIKKQFSK